VGRGGAAQDLRGLTPTRPSGAVEVEVHLFANLADYGPPGAHRGTACVELPEGASLQDLLERLRIPNDLPRLLLVNGREVEPTARLRPGDVVDVLPPLVGGSDAGRSRWTLPGTAGR
jgi:molybdopterin synthase sulfur carrier subunit